MSIIGTIKSLAVPESVKVFFKVAPWVLALVFFGLWRLAVSQENAHALTYKLEQTEQQRDTQAQKAADSDRVASAVEGYAQRLQKIHDDTLSSLDKARSYQNTRDGQLPCLDADRVRGIEGDRRSIFPGYSTGAKGTVPTDPTPSDPN